MTDRCISRSLDTASKWSSDVAQVGHDGGHLRNRLLAPKLPPRTRRRRHRRLEVPDQLGPQNQVLQELTTIGPRLLGHVRKPFIRFVSQEHHPLQELTRANLGASGRVRKLFIRFMVLADHLL